MRISLCNEVLREFSLPEQCRIAASLGYDGLEIAPFTLADDPTRMSDAQIARARRIVEDHGLTVTGLHWLLVAPEGLSLTDPTPTVRTRTRDALAALVDLCSGLGGRVMVHGSPAQRRAGDDRARARALAVEHLRAAAERAAAAEVTYCLEPISADECDFVTNVSEAVEILSEVSHPALRTMIDTGHALRGEEESLPQLTTRWLPTGTIAHFQLNDRNRLAPGQGNDVFAPLLRVLRDANWPHPLAVEPMRYVPDGTGCAARAIGYLRGVMEGLEHG